MMKPDDLFKTPTILPSLLAADFAHLADAIAPLGDIVQAFHLDVMDGHFVPNLTLGPCVVKALRAVTTRWLDVHLMVDDPMRWIDPFADAGANSLCVHMEATPHVERVLRAIRARGCYAGVALTPQTSLDTLDWLYDALDFVLIMTVNPGFGGQAYIPAMTAKIRNLRARLDRVDHPIAIEVDGGIDDRTAPVVAAVGASWLVAGSAVFGATDPVQAVHRLMKAAHDAQLRSL